MTETVQTVLIVILLLCGYAYLLQAVRRRMASRNNFLAISVILLVIYALIMGPLVLILAQSGNMNFVLMAVLLLISCAALFMAFYGMLKNFSELNKGMLGIFFLYVLMVLYVTVFSREEGHSTDVLLHFDSLEEALETRSAEPLQHVFLNAAMFIPLGILFPLIWPERLNRMLYVAPLGLMFSTLIETTQLLMQKGQCDVEDILANTLGAVLGLLLYKLGRRIGLIPGRREDEEEEDMEEE